VLGSRYDGSPIIVGDGSSSPPEHYAHFAPSAHPGCLAPHAWLSDGSSLYDHFGLGFTLLLLNDAAAALAQAIDDAAAKAGVPLAMLDLRGSELEQLYAAPLALIRPDQFVAWRGADADAAALLRTVSGRSAQRQSTLRDIEKRNERLGRVAS
jgi:hypothetical protein